VTSLRPLRVTYLLEDTALFGGVKIALHQANLLHRRGHRVVVASRGPQPSWFELEPRFLQVADFTADDMPEAEVNVATFWTTIDAAAALPGEAIHYCQGYEGSYTHNEAEHSRIVEAYSTPIPAMVLAPHLGELVRDRYNRPTRVVPPALEPWWRPIRRLARHRRPRVLVVHPFEIDWKGVSTALQAVRQLRDQGLALTLVRLSQWPLAAAERALVEPDEYHHHLNPIEVVHLMARCDLLLAPSWEQEGFGLPVLEAMACGLPVVASEISAFRGYAGEAAELVPSRDSEALAEAAARVLRDRRRWRGMRAAGLETAHRFAEEAAAHAAEEALLWAASGDWKSEA